MTRHALLWRLCLLLVSVSLLASVRAQQPAYRQTFRATVDPHLPSYKPIKGVAGDLVTIESEWMDELMKMWTEGFTRIYPNTTIRFLKRETAGAMGVEPALTEGRIQLGPVSRELMPFEIDRFKKKFAYEPLS